MFAPGVLFGIIIGIIIGILCVSFVGNVIIERMIDRVERALNVNILDELIAEE